jgi:hypothetical protein
MGFRAMQNFADCYLEAAPSKRIAKDFAQLMEEAARLCTGPAASAGSNRYELIQFL